ncbi:MAG: fibronectin type III domain-containing protein, partial [bacterium]|nr:fibronectin type III domain-containing protein [bacterium]
IVYSVKSGGTWSKTVVESYHMWDSTIKDVAVTADRLNNVHVVWGRRVDSSDNYNDGHPGTPGTYLHYKKRNSSGMWDTVQNLVLDSTVNPDLISNNILAPDIAVSGEFIHIVWHTAADQNPASRTSLSKIKYMKKTNSSGVSTWSTPVILGSGFTPRVTGLDNDVHTVWYDSQNAATDGDGWWSEIKYRLSRDKGNSFDDEQLIINNDNAPYWAPEDFRPVGGLPCLSLTPSGDKAVIGWRQYGSGLFMYKIKNAAQALEPPKALYIDLVTDSSTALKLKWQKPDSYNPHSYRVYRATNFDTAFIVIDSNIIQTEYLDQGLSSLKQYKYKVCAKVNDAESEKSLPSNLLSPGTRFLINYFEGNEETGPYEYVGAADGDVLTQEIVDAPQRPGKKAQKLRYSYNSTSWGAALECSLASTLDISRYNLARAWIRGDGSTNLLRLAFIEDGADSEVWETKKGISLSATNWQLVTWNMDEMERTSAIQNNIFDRNRIKGYQLSYKTKGASSEYHYLDEIFLEEGYPELSVSTNQVDFGLIAGSGPDKRKQALNYITVNYRNFDGYRWFIRIYTDDSENGKTNLGIQGQSDTLKWLPLKCWCPNYGPKGHTNSRTGPDDENLFFWSGFDFNNNGSLTNIYRDNSQGPYWESMDEGPHQYPFDLNGDGFQEGQQFIPTSQDPLLEEPKWPLIVEKDMMDEAEQGTWRILADWLHDLGNEFNIHFAVDLGGIVPQTYKGRIVIEAILKE